MVAAGGAAATGFPLAASAGMHGDRASASLATAPAVTDVGAYGTFLYTPGLKFAPKQVVVHVGDVVRFTNHSLVPHTATEDHVLWDLAGNYGATPGNPAGIPPSGSVQRTFEAGTHSYYCRVHPQYMHGDIGVPVDLNVTRRVMRRHHHKLFVYTIHARWDAATPPTGLVFDVQRALGSGQFSGWLTGTTQAGGTFTTTHAGAAWHVRARLRRASDASAATGWSPDALVTAR
jgi:plastocyanin